MPTAKSIARDIVAVLVTAALAILVERYINVELAWITVIAGCLVLIWLHELHKPICIWLLAAGKTYPKLTILFAVLAIGVVAIFVYMHKINARKPLSETASKKEAAKSEISVKDERPEKEPPKTVARPTDKKSSLARMGMSPAFAVEEEIAFLSHGGNKFGTRFWLRSAAPLGGCVLYQAQTAIFLRIENLRPYPVTIISYSLEAIKPLIRLSALHNSVFGIGGRGETFYGATRIGEVVPARQGSGFAAMTYIPFDGLAFDQAYMLETDILDEQIIKPLVPNVPIRGWAFFEYPVDDEYFMIVMPRNLAITIKTDRGESFSYPLPMQNGDPNGDVLPRDMRIKDIVDVSNCLRQRYEIPR